jgi:stringent starvation protein B
MTSSRPYLVRALYEWITDNGLTPYILVDVAKEGLQAPLEYADGGKLVLNIAPRAVRDLNVGNDAITFSARFGGVARDVHVPVQAVLAIYARENGQGMLFSERDDGGSTPPAGPQGKGGKPNLRVVK